MHYKRLFLNWIKQKDPQNIFEHQLQRNNKTLKRHVKIAHRFDALILCNSFSWIGSSEGFSYWARLYSDWLEFHNRWARRHQKNIPYEL